MATISLLFKDRYLQNYQIGRGDTLLIGRNSVNDIVIDNLAVSSQHAKIESNGDGFQFVDLHSENGSFVDGRLVKSYWLNDGDAITIGKHTLKFLNPEHIKQEKKQSRHINKTMKIDTKKYRELIRKHKTKEKLGDEPWQEEKSDQKEIVCELSYLSKNQNNLRLNTKLVRLGKAPDSDVLVKGFGIGKKAAVITKSSDGWYISYVEGLSKPRVNGKILKSTAKLKNLDIIAIGSTKLQFLLS